MNIFETSIMIDCSVKQAFEFHSDTNNLKKISPESIEVEIIKIDLPLKLGSEIHLNIKQFGFLKNEWLIRLTAFDKNSLITDTQIKGPFHKWIHDHIFEEIEGKVKMTDRIKYELPFGWLGNIADNMFVGRMISKQFEFRHRVTKEILESKNKIQ